MRRVDPAVFAARLALACQTARGKYLTPYTADDLRDAACYLDDSGHAGGAVKPAADGTPEAVALFNVGAPRGTGRRVLAHLVDAGAARLDCLGEGLRDAYAAAGWAVAEVIPWDDAYAPAGWDYAAHGRPSVFVMTYAAAEEAAA